MLTHNDSKVVKFVQRVPPCSGHKDEKSVQHVPNPFSQSSPIAMEEILEWIRKPMVKTHSSILQKDITVHNPSLKADLPLCHPPSFTSHDSLDQSVSPASYAPSLDSQSAGSNCDQVQGSHITPA